MKKTIWFSCLLILAFLSCEKVNYYEDKPLEYSPTISLAHRGGRTDSLPENNYASCINALSFMAGIEVDVQLSKDRTIWLSHNTKVVGCNGEQNCFVETRDIEIESIDSCNGISHKYSKLADVMNYMDQHNIRKYIAIDLKDWKPCSGNSMAVEDVMKAEAEEIIKLGEKYNLTKYLLFENDFPSVLGWIKKKNSLVKTFITSYGDYEKGMLEALKNNLDGISYKTNFKDELDNDKINLLHKKGIRLMAWNIPDSTYMQFLRSINVDFMQIDL